MARTALITGANRGLGREVARRLAEDGWDVVVAARDGRKAAETTTALRRSARGRVEPLALDVTSDASVAEAAESLRGDGVLLDALVNNAGVYGVKGPDAVAVTLETNFFGPLRVTLGLLPLLRAGATVTNVTSQLGALAHLTAARQRLLSSRTLTREALVEAMRELARGGGGDWGTDAYGVSKAALNALTRLLAGQLAPLQVRVNATCPGWVRTDMGGPGAPRSVEQGAASVLFGVTASQTGGVFSDGLPIDP